MLKNSAQHIFTHGIFAQYKCTQHTDPLCLSELKYLFLLPFVTSAGLLMGLAKSSLQNKQRLMRRYQYTQLTKTNTKYFSSGQKCPCNFIPGSYQLTNYYTFSIAFIPSEESIVGSKKMQFLLLFISWVDSPYHKKAVVCIVLRKNV